MTRRAQRSRLLVLSVAAALAPITLWLLLYVIADAANTLNP